MPPATGSTPARDDGAWGDHALDTSVRVERFG
jgi:hypothetical protein